MRALAIACFVVGCRAPAEPRANPPVPVDPGTGDATPGSGNLFPLTDTSAPSPRSQHTAVWGGGRMLVFGGVDQTDYPRNDGGSYGETTRDWRALGGQSPVPRSGHTAVWTHAGMVVWGGAVRDYLTGAPGVTDTGGLYVPASGSWRSIATHAQPTPRTGHTAVSTGDQMIVWGGTNGEHFGDGASYDANADAWTALPAAGAPSPRFGHTAVWSGKQMIVWGGTTTDGPTATGALYDPAAGAWTPMTTDNAPTPRSFHTAVWAGGKMIVFGGASTAGLIVGAGGLYDPAANTWTPMTTSGEPAARTGHTAVAGVSAANGAEVMIVFGGHSPEAVFGDGGVYSPAKDTWAAFSVPADVSLRTDHTAVWTGDEMVAWGGYSAHGHYLNSGIAYQPP